MDFADLIPKRDQRAILAGMTECGKTTLAKRILENAEYPNIVIIDPKGTFRFPGRVVTTPDELSGLTDSVIIYRPGYEHLFMADYDRVLKWVYLRGKTFVYIDEVYGLSDNGYTYPHALKALYTRGRELGVGVLAATQRPAGIPIYTVSEANRFYIFQLQNAEDRKRVAGYIGEQALQVREGHSFLYYDQKAGGVPKVLTLDLGGYQT